MTKIGLIGCGNWGKLILRDLVLLGCDVSVVAQSAISVQNAKIGNAARIVGTVEELSSQDGYVICTPSNTRYAIIQKLIRINPLTPIFAEKPLCADADEAEKLCQQLPETLFVMDKWRYHTGILALKNLIDSAEFGKVIHISSKRLSRGVIHTDVDTVWNLAPHDLAIAFELLGYIPEPVFARLDITNGEVRGMAACLGQSPYINIEVSDRHHKHFRETKVFFETAIATLSDAYSDSIEIYSTQSLLAKQEPVFENRKFEVRMPLYDELTAFINHIKGGPKPKSSVAIGALVVKTIVKLKSIAQQ